MTWLWNSPVLTCSPAFTEIRVSAFMDWQRLMDQKGAWTSCTQNLECSNFNINIFFFFFSLNIKLLLWTDCCIFLARLNTLLYEWTDIYLTGVLSYQSQDIKRQSYPNLNHSWRIETVFTTKLFHDTLCQDFICLSMNQLKHLIQLLWREEIG